MLGNKDNSSFSHLARKIELISVRVKNSSQGHKHMYHHIFCHHH